MIFLREISRNDLPLINQWRNNREVADMLGGPFRFISPERDENWFEDYLRARGTQVRCAIILKDSKEMVGVVYLTGIDLISHSGEFAIMIGNTSYQGKGIGAQATQMMLEHAFLDLDLHRVYLYVLKENERAIKTYEKAGFSREGKLKEAAYKNGEYKDLVVMAILRKEFLRKRKSA